MDKSVKQIDLKENLANHFADIKSQVTAKDRTNLREEKGYSKGLISSYLNGNIHDLDTGVEILLFFRKCIKVREDKVAIPL